MRARVMMVTVALVVASGCGARETYVNELTAGPKPAPVAEASVELYRNAAPKEAYVRRYVFELTDSDGDEALPRFRAIGAQLGCRVVVVYDQNHPAIAAGPQAEGESLVLEDDGRIVSRNDGGYGPNRREVHVHAADPTRVFILNGKTFGVCLTADR
jgi:hypothetical protein